MWRHCDEHCPDYLPAKKHASLRRIYGICWGSTSISINFSQCRIYEFRFIVMTVEYGIHSAVLILLSASKFILDRRSLTRAIGCCALIRSIVAQQLLMLNTLSGPEGQSSWWRHQMEILFALLALCAGNSPVTGEFPSQRPVMRSLDVFVDLCLNWRLSKQPWGWWFETPSRSLWRHRDDWTYK